jgi:hypothetical protein
MRCEVLNRLRKQKAPPVRAGLDDRFSWWPGAESNHRHKDFQFSRRGIYELSSLPQQRSITVDLLAMDRTG